MRRGHWEPRGSKGSPGAGEGREMGVKSLLSALQCYLESGGLS